MKKGLSVLLIVAALFGFYGGASSLTDVLACKDYWEKEGEKSTADMNKLEDGLNQLGENEQAYLDGVQQVADGEAQLADGRATLAKGEADYAAAPGKLRAAEAAIADGEGKLDDLATLLDGIKQVNDGYNKLAAYEQLRDGRDAALTGKAKKETLASLDTVISLLKIVAADTEGIYARPDNVAAAPSAIAALTSAKSTIEAQTPGSHTNADYADFYDAMSKNYTALSAASSLINEDVAAMAACSEEIKNKTLKGKTISTDFVNGSQAALLKEIVFVATFAGAKKQGATDAAAQTAAGKAMTDLLTNLAILANQEAADQWTVAVGTVNGILNNVKTVLSAASGMDASIANCKTWKEGYELLTSDSTVSAKKTAVGGVSQIISGVYASKNKTLIKGFEKAAKAAGINLKDFKYTATSKLGKDLHSTSSIDDFHNDLKAINKCFQKAKATAKKLKADGEKQLAAGKKQYAAGLASYKAAPGKLADGRKQLADGEKQLADGKKQLAQYEDGEQQVRDGLATLMSTEPNGGLESILDRRGGDDEFDDANGHLDIQEGLDAVDVGRGYQADSGELITKEITNRAVGTAAGLGAAVLACLAALLSLIKKYKGAAVTAVLAAIAGVAGAVVGNGAGSEFSNIAGSTVGSLPWIAAGVVAAVACVFAIVNFTAKAE